ncbi:MAG: tetratricopeptide repeat protein [Anaerolineales bacterium]|nr:tetratricopeptide repeat protein [Anaerolineales bacterium]
MTILTKTIIPVRRNSLIRRQRLLDTLYRNLDYKLTLVTAAAGFGKTSLLVDFAHDTELPVCWLTLDENDNDPTQFLSSITASINHIFPEFGSLTRASLRNASMPEEAVGAMVNDLVANVPELFVLILDDFHLIDSLSIGGVLDRLLRFLPDNMRLILSGRSLPEIDLILLTARQEVTALVPHELCFTARETAELIEQNHSLIVTETDAEALTEKMKGWVTGIVLATQRLTSQIAAQPAEGTLDVIYSFLAQEVLIFQPPHIRDFLLQTSFLPWMTVDICDSLLHRNDAAQVLKLLEKRHLFIELVEGEGELRYRYHPLFREFLLEQLEEWDSSRLQALHRDAARYYAQRGDKEEAIKHYIAINEFYEATSLIDLLAYEMFTSGRHVTLMHWYQLLGERAKNAPRLQLYVSKVMTDRGDHDKALAILRSLLLDPAAVTLQQDIKTQQGHIWFRQGKNKKAIRMLSPLIDSSSKDKNRANALRITGLCLLQQGKPLQAKDYLVQALASFEQLDDVFNQNRVLLDLPIALSRLGEIEEALSYQARALELLRRQGNPASLAMALNNHAYLLHITGRFDQADTLFQEAMENAENSQQKRDKVFIVLGRADLHRDVGRLATALDEYQQALKILDSMNEEWLQNYTRLGISFCYRLIGDLKKAGEWIIKIGNFSDTDLETKVLIERGIQMIFKGDSETGLGDLNKACKILTDKAAYPELAVAELRLAEAYRITGDIQAAVSSLTRAMDYTGYYAERDVQFILEARHYPSLFALGDKNSVNPPILTRLRERIGWIDEICNRSSRLTLSTKPAIQAFAFGDGRVIRGGVEITSVEWKRAVARLLFFYLLDNPPVQRNELFRQFWPDVANNKAASRLHSCVYNARKALGVDLLQFLPDKGCYQIVSSGNIWYDVGEFEKAISQAKKHPMGHVRGELLQYAVGLYSGPFLIDFDEEWACQRRNDLEIANLEAIIDLGDCFYADHDYLSATSWYQRALEYDNYREDVHRRLMLSLSQAGRRAEALRQYEHCVDILFKELGVKPDPATQHLVKKIKES